MLTIKKVTSKKEIRDFITFPLKLYKDCPYFVPPLYMDEKRFFSDKNIYKKTCDTIYFNAYENGKMVGRILGIIQNDSNRKNNEKRVRFSRFDSIDDQRVADALFSAVEKWAIEKGMDTIVGPLSFSDLEREGLLVDGFEYISTFEEQYNYPYYQKLIENLGFEKEVDWTESRLQAPDGYNGDLDKTADFILKRYNLHVAHCKNAKEILDKYQEGFFELLDIAYEDIYGTVPFTDEMKEDLVKTFRLIIDPKFVCMIADENEKVVCFGVCFPSMGEAVQKSGGRLTPITLIKLLKSIKSPKVLDLGLIAVDPKYMNKGVSVVVCANLLHMLQDPKIEYAETNLNLEDNYAIQNQWKRFKEFKHKRRRAYCKKL